MKTLAPLTLLVFSAHSLAEELHDPTRPAQLGPGPAISAPGVEAIRLEAILESGGTRRAIVNGKVVREGERVADVQVTAIHEASIHYVRAGRSHVATLPSRKVTVRGSTALHAGEP